MIVEEQPPHTRVFLGNFGYAIHRTLEDPSSNACASFISNTVLVTILISTAVFVLDSMP